MCRFVSRQSFDDRTVCLQTFISALSFRMVQARASDVSLMSSRANKKSEVVLTRVYMRSSFSWLFMESTFYYFTEHVGPEPFVLGSDPSHTYNGRAIVEVCGR